MNMASIAALEEQVKAARGQERLRFKPQIQAVIRQLKRDGTRVPSRLRNLNEALIQEEIEAKFDNLPL
jgi:hypothetical protein